MKYEVGQKVKIKSLDWYNANRDEYGYVDCGSREFSPKMSDLCGKIATIKEICKTNCYHLEEYDFDWTDEMIECKVEDETKPKFKIGDIIVKAHLRFRIVKVERDRYIVEVTPGINLVVLFKNQDKYRLVAEKIKPEPKFKVEDRVKWYNHTCNITSIDTDEDIYTYLIKHDDYREGKSFAKWVPESELTFEDEETSIKLTGKAIKNNEMVVSIGEYTLPEGYIFKDENGNVINATKIVLEKKQKEYPKTYEECCKVLKKNSDFVPEIRMVSPEESLLFSKLIRLKRCRDAYWKIAGEEMGLGKPWEPDYNGTFENGTPIKYVIYNIGTHIVKERKSSPKHILSFPTEEMRDAFYENFKDLIEACKELL